MLLQIHIVAGALAMILGAVALVAQKGAKVHRRSGQLFVCSMLTMGITASVLGPIANGLMPAYFVVTALTTVRPVTAWTRWVNVSALLAAVTIALGSMDKGLKAFANPGGKLNGVPFFMLFFIGMVMTMAAAGDVRVMWSGPLRGGPRLTRHLWRMCFALFVAAGSFFSVRERVAKILPEQFTTAPMRALPILLLFGAMFYWLWRVRGRRPLPVLVRHDAMLLAAPAKDRVRFHDPPP